MSISRSIDALDREREGKPKVGIYLDNVVVTFNVNAKRTASGTAGLTLASVPVLSRGAMGGNASQTLGAEASRGNQVVMTFKSTSYLSNGTVSGTSNNDKQNNGSSGKPDDKPTIRYWSDLDPVGLDRAKKSCKADPKCTLEF